MGNPIQLNTHEVTFISCTAQINTCELIGAFTPLN